MDNQHSKLEDLIEYGYEFNFGSYFSKGFEIIQKNIGGFIGITIIYFAVSYILGRIPFVGDLAFNIIVSPCLLAGIYIVANKLDNDLSIEFSDFFDGFKMVEKLAIASLLTSLMIFVAMIPMILVVIVAGFGEAFYDLMLYPEEFLGSPEFFPFWIFLFLAPVIYLAIAYLWVVPLIVFYDVDPWPALELSRKIITKQWWIFFGFGFVCGILAVLGILILLIGVLFTLPLVFCAQYAAFADVTRLDHEETVDDDDIIDHLIE